MTSTSFLGLKDAAARGPSGLAVLAEVLTRFAASAEVAACKARHPAEGWASLRVDLVADAPRIAVHAGGSLATEPGGACLRGVLEQLAAATPIPDGTLGAVRYASVQVP